MQSMATRSGRCAASCLVAAAISCSGALGMSASATTSRPGRAHLAVSLRVCSGSGMRMPRRPAGSRAPTRALSTRDGKTTPVSPGNGGNSPVQAKTITVTPSRRSDAIVSPARAATACLEILMSRSPLSRV